MITNRGPQINTLESINTVLRPTFQLAVRDDIIRKDSVDGAYCEIKKRDGGARKNRRILTVERRALLWNTSENPFFGFLLGTRCRIGEAIGIRWDDVDMENKIININHSLTYSQRSDESFRGEF